MALLADYAGWADPVMHRSQAGNRMWGEILHHWRERRLVVPEWQRGRVWKLEQQALWVGHVLSQAPSPALFIRQVDGPNGEADELLDGQQRVNACARWRAGEIHAVLWDGSWVWAENAMMRRMLDRRTIPVCSLPPSTTDAEAIGLYLRLNTAGTPHTDAELDRARRALQETT